MRSLFEKRHYQLIAGALHNDTDPLTIHLLTEMFEADNPKFDKERFIKEIAAHDH